MAAPARPRVGIVGGSRSDFPILERAKELLGELGIEHELRVVSAHRTPDLLFQYAEGAAGRGLEVIIAGAGGAAHLPGMLAVEDPAARHRRADPDPEPGRPGLAALDRPDAARRAGRDRGHRQRRERGPARGRDPGPQRPGPSRPARGLPRRHAPGGPRRSVERRGRVARRP